MTLHIDIETTSVVDLRRTGVFRYAEDRDTHIICACFQRAPSLVAPGDVQLWQPGQEVPHDILMAVESGEPICAWNAQFEATMWASQLGSRHGWPLPPFDQFHCVMAQAMYWGLPAGLADAGDALGLEITKDRTAHALMMRMSRPRAIDKATGEIRWWHEEDAQKLADLIAYCKRDVQSEKLIHDALPPMPEHERLIWLLDQKMNRKGLRVDMDLVDKMSRAVARTEDQLRERMQEITGGAVSSPNAVGALGIWLVEQGVTLPDLRAETLQGAVKALPDGPAKAAIQVRLDGAKASLAKLKAFKQAVCADDHVRGLLRYYGANRTGRWSGAGGAKVQPHNLMKPTFKDVEGATRLLQRGVAPDDLDLLFPDSPMGVVASCMRGVFVP